MAARLQAKVRDRGLGLRPTLDACQRPTIQGFFSQAFTVYQHITL